MLIKIDDTTKEICFLLVMLSLILFTVGSISGSSLLLLCSTIFSILFLFVASVILFMSYVKETQLSKKKLSNRTAPDKVQTQLLNASDDFFKDLLKNYPEKYYIKVSVVKDDFEKTTVPITKIFKGCKKLMD